MLFGTGAVGLGTIDDKVTFAVSEITANNGAGKVHLFTLQGATMPTSVNDAFLVINNDMSTSKNNFFGRGMANGAVIDPVKGADLNKDGYGDILVSSKTTGAKQNGSTYLYYGAKNFSNTPKTASNADYTTIGGDAASGYGLGIYFMSDVTGDGYPDMVYTAPDYSGQVGRVWLFY